MSNTNPEFVEHPATWDGQEPVPEVAASTALANVAVCGKFHLFNYIGLLQRSGRLKNFYFSHRTFPDNKARPEYFRAPLKEYLIQGHARLFGERFLDRMGPIYSDIWNRAVLRHWQPAPLLHFVSNGNCLPLVRRAKADGSKLIAEVVVVHPAHLRTIAVEEAERWRIASRATPNLELERRHERELAQADVVLAPSAFVEETYRSRGLTRPVSIIPYATNIERFVGRAQRRPTDGPLRVLTVGQIGLRKGQLYLLEALKRFQKSEIELTLVGTVADDVRDRLREYEGLFTHINRISNQELAELHRGFDVFLLPSLAEGLAVSICEAMGSGLAVACTRESGGSEIVEHGRTGYIIPSRSVEAIEQFLEFCLQNRDEIGDVGANASRATHNSINWAEYAGRLNLLYDRVAKRL